MKPLRTECRLAAILLALAPFSAVFAAPPAPPQSAAAINAQASQLYASAMKAAQAGNYSLAIDLCQQIVQKVPTAAPVWATLARLQAEQKKIPEALIAAQKAVALSPKTAAFQADLSDYLLRAGIMDRAETTALKTLTLDPKNDVALATLATCRMQTKRYSEALPILRRLQTVRGGKDKRVSASIIAVLLNMRDTKGALATAQSFATKNSTDPEAWLTIADLGTRINNRAAVSSAADHLQKLAPKSPLPFYYRGRLYFTDNTIPAPDRFKKAEVQFKKAVELAPNEPALRSQLGISQAFQGPDRFDDARTNLNMALIKDNHDPVARRGLGWIAEKTQNWDGAATEYDALLHITPNDSEVRRRYAGVLLKAKRTEEAYTQFWELASRNPKNTLYLKELASLFLVDKRFVNARSAYTQVLDRAPNDPDALIGVARCFSEEGDRKQARDYYEKAIAVAPKNETPYLLLAQMYIDDNAKPEAAKLLERMLKTIPDSNTGRWMLIERYIDAKQDDDARREIARLTLRKGDPNRTLYRLASGNLLMARQKYAEAATEFALIASEEPENGAVFLALADADSKSGKPTDAQNLYEKAAHLSEQALTKDTSQAEARSVLIRARTAQGKPDAATVFLKQLDETDKNQGR